MDRPRYETSPFNSGVENQAELRRQWSTYLERLGDPTSECAIFTLDEEGRVTSWNAASERITHRSADIIGAHYSVLYCKEERDGGAPERSLEAAARDGKYETRALLMRTGESSFTAGICLQSLRDASGGLLGFVVIARDFAEQWRQQQILKQAQTEPAHIQKLEALAQLSRGFAHEFNNILQSISGAVELLRRRLRNIDSNSSGVVDMIKRGVDHGTGITRRLLAFAQRPPLQATWIDADEFVADMSALLRQSLPDNVAIETVPGAGSARIWTDANQLETAILNLAANARAAMPQGGKLVIETTKMLLEKASSTVNENVAPGRYVVISVRDTGVGMSKEMITKTFEPFFTTELGYGTGGGLSQVYEFIRESKGHVDILSEPAKGTVVRLCFVEAIATDTQPKAPAASPEQVSTTDEAVTASQRLVRASSTSEALAGRPTKTLSNLRVLVIEDESLVAMLVEDMLDQLGCVVVGSVSDLQPALDVVARSEIDFALLDVNLRGQSSYAVAEALEARAVPFIFISGYGQVDERWRNRPVIQKPFDLDRLRREMERALAGG